MRVVTILVEVLALSETYLAHSVPLQGFAPLSTVNSRQKTAEFLEAAIENSALHDQISTPFLPGQDFDHSALTHGWSLG